MKTDGPRINVFNRQRKLTIDIKSLGVFLERLLGRLDLSAGFSVVLVSDRVMRKYNSRFAGKPRTTDVLSFPAEPGEEPYLGDIIVSVESADRQRQTGLDTELKILALHGVLHLIGYDHESDDGEMNSFEGILRKEFGLK